MQKKIQRLKSKEKKRKTDANVIKFLKDIDMLDEFAEFVKNCRK